VQESMAPQDKSEIAMSEEFWWRQLIEKEADLGCQTSLSPRANSSLFRLRKNLRSEVATDHISRRRR
jgi:hypothetical protein